jgi:hypothetical protein
LQHNTFLLLMHTFVETTLFSIQYTISSDVMSISADEYAPALREACLRVQPADAGACAAYVASDRYAGMHLVWAANFDLAQDASDYYSKIEDLQNTGDCCGFAAPLSCAADARAPPSDRLLDGVSATLQRARQTCGQADRWYPTCGRNSYTCSQAVNPDATELVIGGCKYEMPLGACKDYGACPSSARPNTSFTANPPAARDRSRGRHQRLCVDFGSNHEPEPQHSGSHRLPLHALPGPLSCCCQPHIDVQGQPEFP